VRVDLFAGTVEWVQVHPNHASICTVAIPQSMRAREIFPALQFAGMFDGAVTVL
jgi:hypothetical protein